MPFEYVPLKGSKQFGRIHFENSTFLGPLLLIAVLIVFKFSYQPHQVRLRTSMPRQSQVIKRGYVDAGVSPCPVTLDFINTGNLNQPSQCQQEGYVFLNVNLQSFTMGCLASTVWLLSLSAIGQEARAWQRRGYQEEKLGRGDQGGST